MCTVTKAIDTRIAELNENLDTARRAVESLQLAFESLQRRTVENIAVLQKARTELAAVNSTDTSTIALASLVTAEDLFAVADAEPEEETDGKAKRHRSTKFEIEGITEKVLAFVNELATVSGNAVQNNMASQGIDAVRTRAALGRLVRRASIVQVGSGRNVTYHANDAI